MLMDGLAIKNIFKQVHMNTQLHIVVKMDILPECLGKLKNLIPVFNEQVRKGEPGTTLYKWHINEETMKCYLVETMQTDKDMLTHLQNIGHLLPDLFAVAPIRIWEIYGDLSNEVAEVVTGIAAEHKLTLIRGNFVSGIERVASETAL